jgi:hypothetical protein
MVVLVDHLEALLELEFLFLVVGVEQEQLTYIQMLV